MIILIIVYYIIQVLDYDRIDVFEGTNIQTINLYECIVCLYNYNFGGKILRIW